MTNPFYIMTIGLAAIAITGTIVANYEDAKQSGRPPHMRIYWWHRVRLILFRIIFGRKKLCVKHTPDKPGHSSYLVGRKECVKCFNQKSKKASTKSAKPRLSVQTLIKGSKMRLGKLFGYPKKKPKLFTKSYAKTLRKIVRYYEKHPEKYGYKTPTTTNPRK